MRDIIQELHDKIADDCTPVDVDRAYDDFLDECYSFKSVGGPFAHMLPSKVLSECDPVAYHCGFSDWLDGEELREVGDQWYRLDEVDRIKDELIDDLESELSDLQEELDEEEPETDGWSEAYHRQQDKMTEVNRLEDLLVELRKHTF